MKKLKTIAVWLLICVLAIMVSVFLHECAHGISCMANGYDVSTGFNRVGNAYLYPSDPNFREGFTGGEVLRDIGPATTLLLAVVFTVVFVRKKYSNTLVDKFIFALAVGNSIIRLIPCATVLLRILLTGSGMEDEIEQGAAFAELLGWPYMTCVLATVSIVISVICLYFIYRRYRQIKKQGQSIPNLMWILPAYMIAFVFLNALDNVLRINWIP